MIILNFKKSNRKFEIFDFNPYIFNCPNCNSNSFIKWGFYDRNVYYIENNKIIFDVIKIQRVKCKDCKHTHALLPCPIIPYKQYCLDVILSCLNNDNFIYNYNFSTDTINKWNRQFSFFLPYLKTMFNNISKFDIIDKFKNNIFYYYHLFFIKNNLLLMMIHPRIFGTSYF